MPPCYYWWTEAFQSCPQPDEWSDQIIWGRTTEETLFMHTRRLTFTKSLHFWFPAKWIWFLVIFFGTFLHLNLLCWLLFCLSSILLFQPSVRKTHCGGRKHKENVCTYYQKWLEDQVQKLVDDTSKHFLFITDSQKYTEFKWKLSNLSTFKMTCTKYRRIEKRKVWCNIWVSSIILNAI